MSNQDFPGKWQLHQASRRRLVDIEVQYQESLHSRILEFEGPEKVQLQAYYSALQFDTNYQQFIKINLHTA